MLRRITNLFRKDSGRQVAERLEFLGYFWYADPEEVGMLKEEIANAYEAYGMLSSIYAIKNGLHFPKEFRLYSLNNEALFEKGGVSKFLAEIRPTFKKLHIPVIIEEEIEEYSQSEGFTHSITVNGTRFTIMENLKDYSRGSILATRKFIEIVNHQLERQYSEERAYLISKGLDGQMIFLTQKQFRYISAVYPDTESKPLKVKEWARKYAAL